MQRVNGNNFQIHGGRTQHPGCVCATFSAFAIFFSTTLSQSQVKGIKRNSARVL